MTDALKIGILYSTTGPYGSMGRDARDGAEFALAEISAARQVANERILLNAPPKIQQQGGGGDPTLRTLQALAQLNSARNDLAGTFIGYEQQRVQHLLNLEALTLDDRGLPANDDLLRRALTHFLGARLRRLYPLSVSLGSTYKARRTQRFFSSYLCVLCVSVVQCFGYGFI